MGVELGGGRRRSVDNIDGFLLAAVLILFTLVVWGSGEILNLRDDRAADRKLIAGLVQHEAEQIDLLCDKGVYVDKEACRDGG